MMNLQAKMMHAALVQRMLKYNANRIHQEHPMTTFIGGIVNVDDFKSLTIEHCACT